MPCDNSEKMEVISIGSGDSVQYYVPPDDEEDWRIGAVTLSQRLLLYEVRLLHAHLLTREFTWDDQYGEHWLCIGGYVQRIADNSALSHFTKSPTPYPNNAEVQYRYPGWYDPQKPWRAYAPDAFMAIQEDKLRELSWLFLHFDVGHANEYMDANNVSWIDAGLLGIIVRDFSVLRSVLNRLGPAGQFSRVDFDDNYDPSTLSSLVGAANVAEGIHVARKSAIDLLGGWCFVLARCDPVERKLVLRLYKPYARMWLVHAKKLGTILDPNRNDFHEIPVLQLLADGCPVYLPWDYKYRPTESIAERLALNKLDGDTYRAELNKLNPGSLPDTGLDSWWAEMHGGSLAERISSEPEEGSIREEREVLSFADLLVAAGNLLADVTSQWKLPQLNRPLAWNPSIFRLGTLLLPPNSEVRLRLYGFVDMSDTSTASKEIVREALQRLIPFRIAYEPNAAEELFELNVRWNEDEQQRRRAPGGLMPPRMPFYHNAQTSWAEYLARVALLLAQPHAVAFIFRGGILARLALHFGPPNLLDRFLQGPTRAAGRIVTPNPNEELYCDDISIYDVQILLGTVDGSRPSNARYWWPPEDAYIERVGDTGEWSEWDERWFQTRLNVVVTDSKNARPLSWAEWSNHFNKKIRRRFSSRSAIVPSRSDIEQLVDEMEKRIGSSWAQIRLRDIDEELDADS